ncbi:hypothetical protein [Pseudodesulfovibrio mercurii]|nr:hypothetical protein [Pseudodesulfovibrio mercurii]
MLKIILWLGMLAMLSAGSSFLFLGQEKFGRLPQGARLDRISKSPNYRDGIFHNRVPFKQIVKGGSGLGGLIKFVLRDGDGLTPPVPMPVVKTDLKALDPDADAVAWFVIDEPVNRTQVLSGALILAGILVALYGGAPKSAGKGGVEHEHAAAVAN